MQELLEVLFNEAEERGLPCPPGSVHPRTDLHAHPPAGGRDRRESRTGPRCVTGRRVCRELVPRQVHTRASRTQVAWEDRLPSRESAQRRRATREPASAHVTSPHQGRRSRTHLRRRSQVESCRSAFPGGTMTVRDRVAAAAGAGAHVSGDRCRFSQRSPTQLAISPHRLARSPHTKFQTGTGTPCPGCGWRPAAERSADAGPNRVRFRAQDPSRCPTAELQPFGYSSPFES